MANEITIKVKADDQATKTFQDVDKAAGGFGKTLGTVGTIASGFVLGAAITQGPALLQGLNNAGKDLELQMNKNNIVFGDQIGVVKTWADQNAHSMGLTTTQAITLAGGLADLLIPMGMTREAAAEMATKTIGLSGALAEWSGGQKTAAEVSDILTKAYLGETDGLKALGISISAADIEARLLAKGQGELTGAAREQAEAVAVQEMVFEKSADAQRAFADGSDTAARKQAEMSAKIREAKDDIAVGLQPAFLALTDIVATKVIPTVEELVALFKEHVLPVIKNDIVPLIKAELAGAIEQLKQTWDGLMPILRDNPELIAAIGVALVALVAVIMPIPLAIVGLITVGTLLLAHWDEIRAKVTELVADFKTKFPEVWIVVETVFNLIKNHVETIFNTIKNLFEFWMAIFKGDWDRAWSEVKQIFTGLADGMIDHYRIILEGFVALLGTLGPRLFEQAQIGGQKIISGLIQGVNDMLGWLENKVNDVIDKLNPLNWDFPGLSPFREAFRHAGEIAMTNIGEGMRSKTSIMKEAIMEAAAAAQAKLEEWLASLPAVVGGAPGIMPGDVIGAGPGGGTWTPGGRDETRPGTVFSSGESTALAKVMGISVAALKEKSVEAIAKWLEMQESQGVNIVELLMRAFGSQGLIGADKAAAVAGILKDLAPFGVSANTRDLQGAGITININALDGDSVRRVIPEIAAALQQFNRVNGSLAF